MRWFAPLSCALLALVAGEAAAQAPPDERACAAAFDEAQDEHGKGRLRAASSRFIVCAQPSCPGPLAARCKQWLADLSEKIPSVIIVTQDAGGQDIAPEALHVDGEDVTPRVGRSIPLDPGAHVLEARLPGGARVRQDLVLAEAEKDRRVTLRPPASPPPEALPSEAGSPPAWSYIGFAVAGAGVLLGSITGAISLAKAGELDEACPSHDVCPPELEADHDLGFALAHVSTVSFALAGAGLGVGVLGLLLPSEPASPPSAASVRLLVGTGNIGLTGRF